MVKETGIFSALRQMNAVKQAAKTKSFVALKRTDGVAKVNTEAEWHALRGAYITASEAAVLVSLNPFSSPGKLKQDSGFTGNAFTLCGQVLEPVVVDVTNRVLGTKFRLFEDVEGKSFYTKGCLGATPDATDETDLLECKSTRPKSFLKYIESPPLMYLIQLQVQLHCTNKKIGYLAIMSTDLTQATDVINWPIVIYKVHRNDKICEILETEAKRFLDGFDPNGKNTFRAKSEHKKKVGALLALCCEKIYSEWRQE